MELRTEDRVIDRDLEIIRIQKLKLFKWLTAKVRLSSKTKLATAMGNSGVRGRSGEQKESIKKFNKEETEVGIFLNSTV